MDNADIQKLLHLVRLAVALHGPDWTAPIELVKGQWWYVPQTKAVCGYADGKGKIYDHK